MVRYTTGTATEFDPSGIQTQSYPAPPSWQQTCDLMTTKLRPKVESLCSNAKCKSNTRKTLYFYPLFQELDAIVNRALELAAGQVAAGNQVDDDTIVDDTARRGCKNLIQE